MAVFGGRNNFYLAVGNHVNSLLTGLTLECPAGLHAGPDGRPALFYLITLFQYKENLPDFLAAEALCKRVDWKYALHLPLGFPGLEAAWLCAFRQWLLAEPRRGQNLQALLDRLVGVIPAAERPCVQVRTGDLLETVCQLSRLGILWAAIRQALRVLAGEQPEWLHAIGLPHWSERYRHHLETMIPAADFFSSLGSVLSIGADGAHLLRSISESGRPELAALPEVFRLQQVWEAQSEQASWKATRRNGACARCS
jgi:hypothetical protein